MSAAGPTTNTDLKLSNKPAGFKEVIFANPPKPSIETSGANATFKIQQATIPATIKPNNVVVKVHYLSLDPAMRGWLNQTRSYIKPVEIGEVMRGQSVAQIVETGSAVDSSKLKKGDWVMAMSGWAEYAVLSEKMVEKIDVPEGCLPLDFMSSLGMVALTAYFGLEKIGKLKPSDTVVVSGAAGATGSVAGQIAKIKGCRVIGIAGAKDKCDFLTKNLDFDVAINYKDKDWRDQLKKATPKYIDCYFDNVGGEILDACLGRAAQNSRFIICGAISQYNTAKPKGPTAFLNVISQRVTITGFIVFDYEKEYERARKDLAQWLREGKLKRKEYIIKGGIEEAPAGLVSLFNGANTGKTLVEVAPIDGGASSSKL